MINFSGRINNCVVVVLNQENNLEVSYMGNWAKQDLPIRENNIDFSASIYYKSQRGVTFVGNFLPTTSKKVAVITATNPHLTSKEEERELFKMMTNWKTFSTSIGDAGCQIYATKCGFFVYNYQKREIYNFALCDWLCENSVDDLYSVEQNFNLYSKFCTVDQEKTEKLKQYVIKKHSSEIFRNALHLKDVEIAQWATIREVCQFESLFWLDYGRDEQIPEKIAYRKEGKEFEFSRIISEKSDIYDLMFEEIQANCFSLSEGVYVRNNVYLKVNNNIVEIVEIVESANETIS